MYSQIEDLESLNGIKYTFKGSACICIDIDFPIQRNKYIPL